jgi:hypothetical protein
MFTYDGTSMLEKCALHGLILVSTVSGRWRRVDKWFGDVNLANRVPHDGGGVMVWAGISYGQHQQLHCIDGNLNAQRYRDEILRPIVVPSTSRNHLMFKNYNAQPHVARICTQLLKSENVPVLPWPAYSREM